MLSLDTTAAVESCRREGACLLTNVLGTAQVSRAGERIDALLGERTAGVLESAGVAYGMRDLLSAYPELVAWLHLPAVAGLWRAVLGERVLAVRALFFDKPPEKTWTLPWHRDRTLAVREHPPADSAAARELQRLGFRNPTIKATIPHVVAPNAMLEQMLTLRFSLDPMNADNGPLVYLPGSHRAAEGDEDLAQPPEFPAGDAAVDVSGASSVGGAAPTVPAVATEAEKAELEQNRLEQSGSSWDGSPAVVRVLSCQAGDVFCMRPLLAHSSLKSRPGTQLRRRVVHIELCRAGVLPPELAWYAAIDLA